MRKRWIAMLLVLVCCLPYVSFAETTLYVHNPNGADRLNLRKNPDQNSLSYGKYYNGVEVTVVNTQGKDWAEVRIGSGNGEANGWMMTRYLSAQKPDSAMQQYVTLATVRGYSKPEKSAQTMKIEAGRRFLLMGVAERALDTWWHIRVFIDTSEGPYHAFVRQSDLKQAVKALSPEHGVSVYVSNPDKTDRLHLRTQASVNSRSLGKYYNGCEGEMIGFSEDGEWLKVKLYGRVGWMKSRFLCIEGQRNNTWYGIPTITTTSEWTLVYPGPDKDKSNGNTGLERGTALEVLGLIGSELLHVRKADGTLCYIKTSDTDYVDPKSK